MVLDIQKEVIDRIAMAAGVEVDKIKLERPDLEEFGDYSSNVAMATFAKEKSKGLGVKSPRELAEKIAGSIRVDGVIAKVEVAGGGFINIWLQTDVVINLLNKLLAQAQIDNLVLSNTYERLLIEFAHPNTHKELHIGHMRTLITGEALSRIAEFGGVKVFRANYQGDIGPHVAKSIWGVQKILMSRNTSWDTADELSLGEKAHLLGEGYVKGSQEYEENKTEIDELNTKLYAHEAEVENIYQMTRRWSLSYYDTFYKRFGTKFDRLFFESEVAEGGKKIVEDNVGKVFEKSEGAIIFDGEKYGLHKRVFVTANGNPTYEGKEMALVEKQYEAFKFDRAIHVVANEQTGYFQVVIKAMELIDHKFVGKQFHLPMGMVQLVGKKISSRTGVVLTVDGLLEEVKSLVKPMINREGKTEFEIEEIAEKVTLGAVKYSVLKTHPTLNVAFDLETSVSLEGNSGPYLQYTFARAKSVLAKAGNGRNYEFPVGYKLVKEEERLLKTLFRFEEVVQETLSKYAPNLLATFLYETAQRYNTFYHICPIIKAEGQNERQFRLGLTAVTEKILQKGLELLGIDVPERM